MEDNTPRAPQAPATNSPQNKGGNGGRNRHKHSKHNRANNANNANNTNNQNGAPTNTSGQGASTPPRNQENAGGNGGNAGRSDRNRRNRRDRHRGRQQQQEVIVTTVPLADEAVEEVSVVTGMSDVILREAEEKDRSADELGNELDLIIEAEQRQKDLMTAQIPDVIPEGKAVIIGVRFRVGGKTYYFSPGNQRCKVGQQVVVETARGIECGTICVSNRMIDESLLVSPLRPIIRLATDEDVRHNAENRQKEAEAYRIGLERINAHDLPMKLVSAQYTFDNSKLLFYFTSDGRVDFRELVKDLAGVFHVRIELRQIGIRDETRMIGGLGACGRPLCCTTFLSDFGQVSMKMAKEQNLSLNSTKISGCCGRLMCCLRFEYDTYAEAIKKLPSPGTHVETPDGAGVVTDIVPLANRVKVSLKEHPEASPKLYDRDAIRVVGHPGGDRSRNTSGKSGATKAATAVNESADSDVSEPDSDM